MQNFRIATATDATTCTLILSGEADLAVAAEITDIGVQRCDEPGVTRLVVDLSEVTFIDSTALGALVHLRNVAEAAGKQFHLAHVPTRVQRVLAISGLDQVFTTADDKSESLERRREPGIAARSPMRSRHGESQPLPVAGPTQRAPRSRDPGRLRDLDRRLRAVPLVARKATGMAARARLDARNAAENRRPTSTATRQVSRTRPGCEADASRQHLLNPPRDPHGDDRTFVVLDLRVGRVQQLTRFVRTDQVERFGTEAVMASAEPHRLLRRDSPAYRFRSSTRRRPAISASVMSVRLSSRP